MLYWKRVWQELADFFNPETMAKTIIIIMAIIGILVGGTVFGLIINKIFQR
jgi:hypothetical protein